MQSSHDLGAADWIVLCAYAALLLVIGLRASREETSTDDYFLGGRRMPWWAVMISIYATSLSALTFIGVPGAAYSGDFNYLQLGIGDLFGRLFVVALLLGPYYAHRVTTVYQLLGNRFGPRTHDAGAGFFIVTRLLASGVRLAGCAIALSVVFGLPLEPTVAMIACVAVAYTLTGGIKAVIWTDILQFALFIAAAGIALTTIIGALPGGLSDFTAIAAAAEKFKVFHFSLEPGHNDYWLNVGNPDSLIAGVVFGCLSTLAAMGTDQDLVQRMLTCENVNQSRKALILTAVMNVPITVLFLSVGAALFVYYNVFPDPVVTEMEALKQTDKIFPYFIRTALPQGLRGLLIAGLLAAAMSSLDSALNALASTGYVDIIQRYSRRLSRAADSVRISRIMVLLFGVLLTVIGIVFAHTESILWLGFRITGYTYGALLGIFLLAVTTRSRGCDRTNLIAMLSSLAVVVFLTAESVGVLGGLRTALLSPLGVDAIAWPWAIVVGTTWTLVFSAMFAEEQPSQSRTGTEEQR